MTSEPTKKAGAERVLKTPEAAQKVKYHVEDPEALGAWIFLAIGTVFILVGVIDFVLAWLPLRFGAQGWEFAIISQTFTNLPATLLGIGLLTYGLIQHPGASPRWLRVEAIVLWVVAGGLVLMGILYLVSSVEVWRASTSEARVGVFKAVVRVLADVAIYPLLLVFIGFMLRRGARTV